MALQSSLQSLINNQESLFDILSEAWTNYEKSKKPNTKSSCTGMRNDLLDSLYQKFYEQHEKIEMSVEEDEKTLWTYFTEDLCEQFEQMYIKYKTKMTEDNIVSVPKTPMTSVSRDLLPEIPLPTFAGGYENWLSFRSIFYSLIHENADLSAFEKIYYLKNCLRGIAKKELKYIYTTGYNYEYAWKRLNEHYNNRERNTNEVLKRLFALKSMRPDSSNDINQLLITTLGCLASLKTLDVDVGSWDPIINHIVETKLDRNSHDEWVRQVVNKGADELPTWEQLQMFLQNRFKFLETMEMSKIDKQNSP